MRMLRHAYRAYLLWRYYNHHCSPRDCTDCLTRLNKWHDLRQDFPKARIVR